MSIHTRRILIFLFLLTISLLMGISGAIKKAHGAELIPRTAEVLEVCGPPQQVRTLIKGVKDFVIDKRKAKEAAPDSIECALLRMDKLHPQSLAGQMFQALYDISRKGRDTLSLPLGKKKPTNFSQRGNALFEEWAGHLGQGVQPGLFTGHVLAGHQMANAFAERVIAFKKGKGPSPMDANGKALFRASVQLIREAAPEHQRLVESLDELLN